ncbi:MAG: hypothetical protein H3C47_09750 [Candidatus Cloacimonetes bacterium]|nr:hypothetical protein [Candidatus Cloacimonadota bacterium]
MSIQNSIVHMLVLDWPKNWTGAESQILKPFPGTADSVLVHKIRQIEQLPGSIRICLRSPIHLQSEIIEQLKPFTDKVYVYPIDEPELSMFLKASQDLEPDVFIQKHIPEDFMPVDPVIFNWLDSVCRGDLDFVFSIHHDTGVNFEAFSKKALIHLSEVSPGWKERVKLAFAHHHYEHFKCKRIQIREVYQTGDLLRLTLDNETRYQKLCDFVKSHPKDWVTNFREEVKSDPDWTQPLVPPYFEHRPQVQGFISDPGVVQFMERGLVFKRRIHKHLPHLDLCSGSMTLPEFVYSLATDKLYCMEDGEHAERIYAERNLERTGIRLIKGNALNQESWDRLKKLAPFGSISWTAAIEHFTIDEQNYILSQIQTILSEDGYLFGDTNLFQKDGMLGCWQHRNEFYCEEDLRNLMSRHFESVDVFTSKYKNLPLQPVYFCCSKPKTRTA